MLSTKQNQFVHDGTLKVNCCIRLNSYILDVVRVKKIIIIFDLAVEHPDITQRIGNPVWIDNLNLDLRFSGTTLTYWVSEGLLQAAAEKPWQAYRLKMWVADMKNHEKVEDAGGCWRREGLRTVACMLGASRLCRKTSAWPSVSAPSVQLRPVQIEAP